MNFDNLPMANFVNDGLELAYFDAGDPDGPTVLLIHGFASTAHVNWVYPGWVGTLGNAGYRVVALDNRGHGRSARPHDPEYYAPPLMAGDALALLDHLGIGSAHLFGYSMGARIAAYVMRADLARVRSAVFGGLGIGLVEGVGDWDPIADALLADDPGTIADEKGRMFRAFADQTGSDRKALAACIRASRTTLTPAELSRFDVPVLIGIGDRDEIAGSGDALARLLPDATAIGIPRRDHMMAVGDKVFKAAVVEFLASHRGA